MDLRLVTNDEREFPFTYTNNDRGVAAMMASQPGNTTTAQTMLKGIMRVTSQEAQTIYYALQAQVTRMNSDMQTAVEENDHEETMFLSEQIARASKLLYDLQLNCDQGNEMLVRTAWLNVV